MMVTILFLANLAAAAATLALLWRRDTLRSSWVFHVAALVAAAAIYAAMTALAAQAELAEEAIPFRFGARAFVGALAWLPFLIFLAVTYVRALGAAAEDGITATGRRMEEARRSVEFGQDARAWKLLRALLDEDPGNVEARALMADVQLKRGKYDLALGSLRLAMAGVDRDEQFARFVFKAAILLNEHMGDPKAAAHELDLIRRRMPDTPQAAKAQEWIVRLMDDAAREEA